MNNQKQFLSFINKRNRTKKAIRLYKILALAFVMLYEEASAPPIELNAFNNTAENVQYEVSSNIKEGGLTAGLSKALFDITLDSTISVVSTKKDEEIPSVSSSYNDIDVVENLICTKVISNDVSQESKSLEEIRFEKIKNEINITGYLTSNLNIRTSPSMDSDIFDVYSYNTEITYGNYDDNWAIIKYGDTYCYVSRKYISDSPLIAEYGYDSPRKGRQVYLPDNLGTSNTFMGWQMITSTSSPQYRLRSIAGENYDNYGYGIINGRYAIATTTTYGDVGDYIDITRADGSVLKAIIVDIKNQDDYNCNEWGHDNGRVVVEFVVDKDRWYSSNGGRLNGYEIISSTSPGNNTNSVITVTNVGSYFN